MPVCNFVVSHFNSDVHYRCEDFNWARSSSCSSVTSSSSTGERGVPRVILRILDELVLPTMGDGDWGTILDEVYEQTFYHEFWNNEEVDLEISRLIRSRYLQILGREAQLSRVGD